MSEKEEAPKQPEIEPLDDEALEKLAVEELMREAVQGAARAELVGPSGWVQGSLPKTNKRFLVNTIRNAVSANKYRSTRNRRSHRSPPHFRYSDSSIKKDTSKRKH